MHKVARADRRGPGWLAPGSLLVAGAGFLATLRAGGVVGETVHAGCEAALIGGLADWFAVTALFRRPLGLPIPHTDIVRRKRREIVAQIRATLDSDWLSAGSIREALDRARLTDHGLEFLAEAANRSQVEKLLREFLLHLVQGVDPAALAELLAPEIERRLAGRRPADDLAAGLDFAATQGWDEAAVAAVSGSLGEWLAEPTHVERVAEVLKRRAREWAAGKGWRNFLLAAGDELNLIPWDRLARGAVATLRDEMLAMSAAADHPLRLGLRRRLERWRAELRRPGVARDRATEVGARIAAALPVTTLVRDLLREGRAALLADLERPRSAALGGLIEELDRLAERLRRDPALRDRLDAWLRGRLVELVERHHAALGDLVVRNLEKRTAVDWVRDIERRIGPDLQYIRLNGALVGGLVGVALSLLRRWLG